MKKLKSNLVAVAAALTTPGIALATNGMNLEAYGPIAGGMGGASMAYDNGTAAMMNNPATLGMMPSGGKRLDVALGMLGPDVTAKMTGQADAKSSADAFYMPAVGWAAKSNALTYGVGVFAQGGMGTEYAGNSFLSLSGETVRSEVGVGRAMIPLTFDATDKLIIGGSLDFVWAGMDLQMDMSSAQLGQLMAGQGGSITPSATMGAALQNMMPNLNYARFDFSNNSNYTGQAFGTGFAGKLGFVYKAGSRVTIGGTYQSKTNLSDLTTSDATMSMNVTGMGTVPLSGEMKVRNFEWPSTYALGAAFKLTDRFLFAADVKRINWSGVMDSFNMAFTVDQSASNNLSSVPGGADFRGETLDASLTQNWEDQTAISMGASFRATDALTVRAGFNRGANPVPDMYLNALFPAIVENHITVGGGYDFTKSSTVNASLTLATENSATAGSGIESVHSQFNWQVMYSLSF